MDFLSDLRDDVRFAFRYFARNKATSAIVIAVLALGIGANTVIFSALQAEMLRPAPAMPDDDRLVRVYSTQRDSLTAAWKERDPAGYQSALDEMYKTGATTLPNGEKLYFDQEAAGKAFQALPPDASPEERKTAMMQLGLIRKA